MKRAIDPLLMSWSENSGFNIYKHRCPIEQMFIAAINLNHTCKPVIYSCTHTDKRRKVKFKLNSRLNYKNTSLSST